MWQYRHVCSRNTHFLTGQVLACLGLLLGCTRGQLNWVVNSGLSGSDLSKPPNNSVLINGGAAYTNQLSVTLTLTSQGAAQMYISNGPDCSSGGSWQSFSPTVAWTLPQANSINTVYTRYADSSGKTSSCATASILHDNIAPSLTGSIAAQPGNASVSTTPSVTGWPPTAADGGSGIQKLQWAIGTTAGSNDVYGWHDIGGGANPSDPFPYTDTSGLHLNKITRYFLSFRAVDNAGNISVVINSSSWIIPLVVTPVYPKYGANWNDYVEPGVDTPCTGSEMPDYNACVHGGEKKQVVIDGVPSCAGLSMSDALGAFTWSCDASSGTAVFTTLGWQGNGLEDLVNTTSWKADSVTLSDNGTPMNSSAPAPWWSNPVTALPDSSITAQILSSPGTVYTFASNQISMGYNLNADKIALVGLTGATLTAEGGIVANIGSSGSLAGAVGASGYSALISSGGHKFIWIEGSFSGNSVAETGILLGNLSFSRIHQATVAGASTVSGIYLASGTQKNYFSYLTSESNGGQGIELSGDGTGSPQYNIFSNIVVSGNGASTAGSGFYLANNSSNNTFASVTADSNAGNGVEMDNGSGFNTLNEVAASYNGGFGILVNGAGSPAVNDVASSGNRMSNVTVASDGTDPNGGGIFLQSDNNVLTAVRAANNYGKGGIEIGGASNTLSQVTLDNNCQQGMIVASVNSLYSQVIAMGNATSGGIYVNGGFNNSFVGVTSTAGTNGIIVDNGNGAITGAGSNNIFHQLLIYGNSNDGISVQNGAGGNLFGQAYVSKNPTDVALGNTPAHSVSNNNKFTGVLATSGICSLGSSDSNPGLTASCADQGLSDATTSVAQDVIGSFVGMLSTRDGQNTSDTPSLNPAYPGAKGSFDWMDFGNIYRGWLIKGAAGAIASGQWLSGNGAIYDFGLRAADTILLNRSDNLSSSNGVFVPGQNCPSQVSGSVALTTIGGTPYLKNAMEVPGHSGNNGDGLCESGETCIYTPNFGAYQGHGTLGTCLFQNGTVSGVTMYGYSNNGF